MRIDDPELVRREYESDAGLAGRIAAYRFSEGPDPREVAFRAVAEAAPRRVLEVGCGQGVMAEQIQRELRCELVALDQSPHMVSLTRERGVEAVVGDVQDLPFATASFDVALAAWMLYHVPDLERALSELARVIRPGGRLVAVANAADHLRELRELLGARNGPGLWPGRDRAFSGENGEGHLLRHFARVERREAFGWIAFPSRREAQAYVDASATLAGARRSLPEFDGQLRVRRAPVVLVAERA